MNQTQQNKTPNQWQRRIAYGTNVAVLLIAVLAIVVLVNWLAVRKAGQWPGTRIDMTASRKYTLSEQTEKLLASLERDLRIVTVFASGMRLEPTTAKMIEDFEDLLGEYALRGGAKITVDQVDANDIEAVEAFLAEVRGLYEEPTQTADAAIDRAIDTFARIKQFANAQSTYLLQRLPGVQKVSEGAATNTQTLARSLASAPVNMQLDEALSRVAAIKEQPLPAYEEAIDLVRQPIDNLKAGLTEIRKGTADYVGDDADPAVRETFTAFRKAAAEMLSRLEDALAQLDAVDLADYNAVRKSVLGANTVAVMSDTAMTTLELADVYSTPESDDGSTEQRFRGEEAVTGAILSLTLDNPPLVVFVTAGPQPAIGPRGTYGHVADRLLKMNFEVTEWFPGGRQTQFGPMPAGERPQPDEGQPVVWIFVPSEQFDPSAFAVDQALAETIASGEPFLLPVARRPMSMPNPEDPLATIAQKFGITAEPTHLVLSTRVGQDGQVLPTSAIRTTRWTDDHPIAQSLAGGSILAGAVVQLTVDAGATEAEGWPLVHTDDAAWAEHDWMDQSAWPQHDPQTEDAGPFPIAVAAEAQADGQRMVMFADSQLVTNQMVLRERAVIQEGGLAVVEELVLPGNAELFANSVYWLTGMDELIGTGAQSQDIRRIGRITETDGRLVGWLLLAGLPLATLIAGAVVGLIRRK